MSLKIGAETQASKKRRRVEPTTVPRPTASATAVGGKSTYIRTLGLLAVLAQMGCYVPADAATLPLFDCVAARIGAGDK